jgi:GH24 family phage-related lysozyme (muramidase)
VSYIDDAVNSTIQWEGSIPWMYLDTKGNVTAGCGLEIPNTGIACGLPFQLRSGGAATEDDIIADFHRVKNMPPAKPAGFYYSDSSPVLEKADIQNLLRKRITADDGTLRAAFAGWDAYPAAAKQAILDMEYNLGEGELLRGYPAMDADIRAADWIGVASQCHRKGISDARNTWTKNLFLSAVQAA